MKKILLIEDNNDIRENTAEILELSNYTVFTADNGKTGIQTALEQVPDLIICDIMMPGLDGYGVLHAVQKNETLKNIPFIFLTAKSERSDLRKGMELGADDYITKPFDGTELLNAVDRRLKKIESLSQQLLSANEGIHLPEGTTRRPKGNLDTFLDDRDINIYRKKQMIYSEGNHPMRLYYVVKGKVKAFKTHEDGKELVTELYSPGDYIGYIALLENAPYRDSAEAMETTELALIPKEDFEELLTNNPEAARKFIRLLAKNISEKENQLLGLAYNSLRKKVAEALLFLKTKYQQEKDQLFSVELSRESLANIAGTATESLIRTLSDFRDEKLIEIEKGKITIIDPLKLQRLLN